MSTPSEKVKYACLQSQNFEVLGMVLVTIVCRTLCDEIKSRLFTPNVKDGCWMTLVFFYY